MTLRLVSGTVGGEGWIGSALVFSSSILISIRIYLTASFYNMQNLREALLRGSNVSDSKLCVIRKSQ